MVPLGNTNVLLPEGEMDAGWAYSHVTLPGAQGRQAARRSVLLRVAADHLGDPHPLSSPGTLGPLLPQEFTPVFKLCSLGAAGWKKSGGEPGGLPAGTIGHLPFSPLRNNSWVHLYVSFP